MNVSRSRFPRRQLAVAVLPCLVLGFAVGGMAGADAARAITSPAKPCGWKVVAAPTPGVGTAELNGVDALSPKDIWAVGYFNASGATLTEHWNGHKWSVVKSPNKSGFTALQDVDVVSHKNAWAVGYFVPSGGSNPKTLVEHWNGKKWAIVKSPNPVKGTNVLFGVGATAKSVIAVGTDNLGAGAGSKQITLRLSHGKWKATAHPAGLAGAEDVAAFSSTSALAVGHIQVGVGDDPLVESFNGSKWVRQPVTSSATGPTLEAVSAPKPAFGWAVGAQSVGPATQTFAVRHTASGWATVDSADTSPTQINDLHGVATLSRHEAWAVGYHDNSAFTKRTLIEHFSGGAWTIVSSPSPTTHANELLDVTATRGDLWAVGYADKTIGSRVVVESRRC
jgi:hypothetical protein